MPYKSPYGSSGQAHCACRRRQTKEPNTTQQNKPPPQPPPAKVTPKDLVTRQQRAASRQTPRGRLDGAGAAAENRPTPSRRKTGRALPRLVGVKSNYCQTAPSEKFSGIFVPWRAANFVHLAEGAFLASVHQKHRVFRGKWASGVAAGWFFPAGGNRPVVTHAVQNGVKTAVSCRC